MKAADWKFDRVHLDVEDVTAQAKAAEGFFARPLDYVTPREAPHHAFDAGFARGIAWARARATAPAPSASPATEDEALVDAVVEHATDNASCDEGPESECNTKHLSDLNAARTALLDHLSALRRRAEEAEEDAERAERLANIAVNNARDRAVEAERESASLRAEVAALRQERDDARFDGANARAEVERLRKPPDYQRDGVWCCGVHRTPLAGGENGNCAECVAAAVPITTLPPLPPGEVKSAGWDGQPEALARFLRARHGAPPCAACARGDHTNACGGPESGCGCAAANHFHRAHTP